MDKVVRKYDSLDEMKADEIRAWQALPAYERMNAVAAISLETYGLKKTGENVQRLQRTLVHLPSPER